MHRTWQNYLQEFPEWNRTNGYVLWCFCCICLAFT